MTEEEQAKERVLCRNAAEGLVRCTVCGGFPEVNVFGRDRFGVWVGCTRTVECSRYVEYHKDGWSVTETIADWNRRNSGIRGAIRRLKRWIRTKVLRKKPLEKVKIGQ